ncbi:MAG: GntR family transcriptional regulator [Lentisphaerae bacterium]|nr:GntR family transcriptional regulator [Lentisphaerota bacterium]
MQFQFKNDVIYNILRERIQNGTYPVGMKLPPETVFARELQVGKVTLRSALARLEQENLIVRMRSRGTFVKGSAASRVKKLAVITGSDNNLGCPTQYLMKLLMKSAEKQGIVLEVIDPMLVELLPEKLIKRFFQDKAIEGVVILTGYFTGQEPLVQRMKALKLPVVLPHGEMGDNLRTGFASVVADERRAFAQTLEFVQHKNFKRIAVVGHKADGEERCRGFSQAELKKACNGNLYDLSYMEYDLDAIARHVNKLCNGPAQKPDVFVCYSDLYAIFLLSELKKLKLRVPEDISVIGFSGFNCDFRIDTKLAGIKYRYSDMVEKALELLTQHKEWFDPAAPEKAPEVKIDCDFEFSGSVI